MQLCFILMVGSPGGYVLNIWARWANILMLVYGYCAVSGPPLVRLFLQSISRLLLAPSFVQRVCLYSLRNTQGHTANEFWHYSHPVYHRCRGSFLSQACSIVFAPEKMRQRGQSNPAHFYQDDSAGNRVESGPLAIALQARPQLELFCTQPLVLDFLSRSFTRGLPALDASEAGMQEADEVKLCRQRNMSVQVASSDDRESSQGLSHELLEVLEGPHQTFGSLTFFPGAQFILAQLVARPAFCYSVPAVRMGMDLFVYVLMLLLFSKGVIWYEGDVGVGEMVFFLYVLGAILVEMNELWDGREDYMKDHWNALDVAALAFCGSAFLVRMYDPDSMWGRALYGAGTYLLCVSCSLLGRFRFDALPISPCPTAILYPAVIARSKCVSPSLSPSAPRSIHAPGAPLLLFRMLFFAQFMPAQGPMIEVRDRLRGCSWKITEIG